jgi:hypothetical protein
MRHLRERDIPLEICLTSNLITGVVKSLEEHPLRRLYDAGVPIVLNTDDPAMFGCTLTGEYRLAARQFGFSEAEMRGIAENGFRYSFRLPAAIPNEKTVAAMLETNNPAALKRYRSFRDLCGPKQRRRSCRRFFPQTGQDHRRHRGCPLGPALQ